MAFVILCLILNTFVSYFSQSVALVPFAGEDVVHKITVLRSYTAGLDTTDTRQAELVHIGLETNSVHTFLFGIGNQFW
jgi:hypothetical protein